MGFKLQKYGMHIILDNIIIKLEETIFSNMTSFLARNKFEHAIYHRIAIAAIRTISHKTIFFVRNNTQTQSY